jgi:hypothetical protein
MAPLGSALALHGVILLLLMTWRVPLAATAPVAEPVSLYLLPGRAKTPARPKPDIKTPPTPGESHTAVLNAPRPDPPRDRASIPIDQPSSPAAPSAAVQALALAQAGGSSCQILDVLQAMLQSSDDVRQALPRIPARSRSVANAVMLWDRGWTDGPTLGGASVLAAIQSTVAFGVRAAPPGCQAEVVRGPRLITVGDAQGVVVLAFGSGEWRWADLLVDP